MVDVVSIVIAVVSLIGSLVAAGFTGWISFYLDQVKRRSEAKALIHKYRDPLMLAAYDLQSRLWGLSQGVLLRYTEDENKKDLVYVYTAFLVGQYFSWVYILRRQAQFLRFSTDKVNNELNKILDSITHQFSIDDYKDEHPFMLWRGQQMAIGESMTMTEEGQMYCIGFAAFALKYKNDLDFKRWFEPVDTGITHLVEANARGNPLANYRLRRVQHLLVDLVILLDEQRLSITGNSQLKVDAAHECKCAKCPGVIVAKPPLAAQFSKTTEP